MVTSFCVETKEEEEEERHWVTDFRGNLTVATSLCVGEFLGIRICLLVWLLYCLTPCFLDLSGCFVHIFPSYDLPSVRFVSFITLPAAQRFCCYLVC